jgi:hypothetical protein
MTENPKSDSAKADDVPEAKPQKKRYEKPVIAERSKMTFCNRNYMFNHCKDEGYWPHLYWNWKVALKSLVSCVFHFVHGIVPVTYTSHDCWGFSPRGRKSGSDKSGGN